MNFEDFVNKITCGNSIELIKFIPSKKIDLTLTDFPYGNETNYGNTYEDTQENLISLIEKIMPEILRVSKVTFISTGTMNISLYPKPDWIICWNVPSGVGVGKWGFCCWHPILVYGKDPYLSNGMGSYPDSITSNETSLKTIHPCAKPLGVWEWLLKRGSPFDTDIIFDPFMGSGSTAIVAKQLGRKFVGFEINPEFVDLSNKRLDKVKVKRCLLDYD